MKTRNYLAVIIKRLRARENYVKFAQRTGVNRQTLTELEQGIPVRLETLRRIAKGCKLDERQWAELLIAWLRVTMGEKEFANLDVRAAPSPAVVKDLMAADELFLRLFHRLGNTEKADILKAMMRREVRACLTAINAVWERGQDLDRVVEREAPSNWEEVANQIAKLEDVKPPMAGKSKRSAVR